MDCSQWQEYQKTVATSILRYDFRVKHPSSFRSFPVFFGKKEKSDRLLFPVGEIENSFALEVIIRITDTLKDYSKYVTSLRVSGKILYILCSIISY